jgi:Mycothiol maleylpyruvate isomerase N-terminal domain
MEGRMSGDRSFIAQNDRERERMRRLIERASEGDLSRPVNEYWTVAGVLGHVAFWDARALFLAGKLERGQPFTESDAEPEDVSWINDSARPLIHAIPPRDAAKLAFRIAEETDGKISTLPAEKMWPLDGTSPLNPLRASHRGEHLDEIEAALEAPERARSSR